MDLFGRCLVCLSLGLILTAGPAAHAATKKSTPAPSKQSAAAATAQRYVQAVAAGDKVAVGKLDFACAYRLAASGAKPPQAFPPDADPLYAACWEPIAHTHASVIQQKDQGLETLWPGKGSLVFFREELTRFAPSLFVMDRLGASPPAGGFIIEPAGSQSLPAASFRMTDDGPVLAAPATLVRLVINYKDPLSAPVTYAPDAYKWTNTIKRPRQALKSVTLRWIVLSDLKKLGFPDDTAVLNLPVKEESASGPQVPFTTQPGGYEPKSGRWWQPNDTPGLLIAAVGRAAQFPELRDRIGMLNRVLIIDPSQAEALTLLTHDLYQILLNLAAIAHNVPVKDSALATALSELYWNTYAQTTRTDLSLGMEMGGFAQPTAADFLYRMIPAMEQLAKVRPQDFDNRLKLGNAYRWNVDQLVAIETHEALLKEIPPQRTAVRARVLNELAWSRIAKVAWNRTYEDPGIVQAYKEAEEAYQLADKPLDKFLAAYTMAFSLIFTPQRDNQVVLERLTEAKKLFLDLPGESPAVWAYLLNHEQLKAVLDSDPRFKPLR